MGTWSWRTLHPRQILHAPVAISVYGGVSQGELQIRTLQSGAECYVDWPMRPYSEFEENPQSCFWLVGWLGLTSDKSYTVDYWKLSGDMPSQFWSAEGMAPSLWYSQQRLIYGGTLRGPKLKRASNWLRYAIDISLFENKF